MEGGMALHFSRTIDELEIWSASERGFSFVISNESSGGLGLHGQSGFYSATIWMGSSVILIAARHRLCSFLVPYKD
jgi:hypothetical protein